MDGIFIDMLLYHVFVVQVDDYNIIMKSRKMFCVSLLIEIVFHNCLKAFLIGIFGIFKLF